METILPGEATCGRATREGWRARDRAFHPNARRRGDRATGAWPEQP